MGDDRRFEPHLVEREARAVRLERRQLSVSDHDAEVARHRVTGVDDLVTLDDAQARAPRFGEPRDLHAPARIAASISSTSLGATKSFGTGGPHA